MHSQTEIAIYFFMSLCHNWRRDFLWRCVNNEEYQEILRSVGRDGYGVWCEYCLCRLAADKGHAYATYRLAKIYEGKGEDMLYIHYLQQAKDMGNVEAAVEYENNRTTTSSPDSPPQSSQDITGWVSGQCIT